jgi:hypothetical protein
MFLVRSAFWLTVGFLVIAPHGTDFGSTATSLRDQAVEAGMEAGGQMLMGQLAAQALPVLLDFPAAAESAAAASSSPVGPIVFPRARPAALG